MPVKEADPRARQLEDAFAAAMDAPAKPREAPAPPEVDREAPHGREDDGTPKAPYGLNKDGSVRKSAAGRKAKDEQPRTVATQAATEPDKPAGILAPRDYSAELMDAGETIWFGGSIIAKVGPQVPVLGRFIPGAKLAATMAVFDAERPRLAAALNLAAQHDARARKLAAKLADGEVQWALTCMFMVAPFTGALAAVWQGDKALAERELPSLAELGKRNEDALDRALTKIAGQMEAAQQAQAEEIQRQMLAAMQAQAAQNGQVPAGA
jgi:hypothetical protein